PYGIPKFIAAIAFLAASEISVAACYQAYSKRTVGWLRTIITFTRRKRIRWISLTPEMQKIAKEMGVKISRVGVVDDLHNAVSMPFLKQIIIGKPLFDSLDDKKLEAVFAHELAHVKEKHNLVVLAALPVIMAQLWQ